MSLAAPYRLLLSVLAPPCCPACRDPLPGRHDGLCAACARELPWLGRALCPRCALPLPCGPRCPAAGRGWDLAWAPFAHDGPARALVAALKFRGLTTSAELLAAPLAAGGRALLEEAALVAVPADPARLRRRGFDHAELIAAALARRSGRPVARCLRREGRGDVRQLGAGRAVRLAGGGRMSVVACAPVPSRVVLVDDVHTTGATLDACARALRAGGAEVVHALTATRAIG